MKINEFQHPDSIWTWKSGGRQKRVSLWLPYFQSTKSGSGKNKDVYSFTYNGGTFEADLKRIDCIMLYGATGDLPVSFLDRLSNYGITLLIHRRNIGKPYLFLPGYGSPTSDILTNQILYRENNIRRVYIARTLIRERFKSMMRMRRLPVSIFKKLSATRTLDKVRVLEADVTRRYWRAFFRAVGAPKLSRRENKHPINAALDAGSFFMYGVILRWILLHRLSPWHGFLHEPVNYPALCYDLMEPFRYLIEDSVAKSVEKDGADSEKLTSLSLSCLKETLEHITYTPVTRQQVAKKNLIHGSVLALRAYLMKETKRLIIPTEGEPSSGRPLKVSYSIPGGVRGGKR